MNTAIDFPGESRIHVGLAVTDLARSKAFYEILLGVAPAKERPGYAKFEPADPSVNLTLNEVATSERPSAAAMHYGVQVRSTEAVQEAIERFERAGLATSVEKDTTCCYAVQDKVWVEDPDGHRWEVFVVTEADAPERKSEVSSCCAPTEEPVSTCC